MADIMHITLCMYTCILFISQPRNQFINLFISQPRNQNQSIVY